MPELPEVETVRRLLEPQLTGRKITGLTVVRPEIIEHPTSEEFTAALTGATIAGMLRRGKFLSIVLESDDRVVLHLRMTGSLLVTPPEHPQEKHTHLVLHLDDGNQLRFVDIRRFGRFWLLPKDTEDTLSGIHRLGPEPFGGQITAGYLSGLLGKRKRAVKDCLLDQQVVAGIGNIYADEILFAAKIRPDRPANSLSAGEWERLASAIGPVLTDAVEKNAMTPEEYLAGNGQEYRSAPFFRVYGHRGEPCPVCGEILCRLVVAGRGSVYCPVCQKEEAAAL